MSNIDLPSGNFPAKVSSIIPCPLTLQIHKFVAVWSGISGKIVSETKTDPRENQVVGTSSRNTLSCYIIERSALTSLPWKCRVKNVIVFFIVFLSFHSFHSTWIFVSCFFFFWSTYVRFRTAFCSCLEICNKVVKNKPRIEF